jgi:hypothetical protein
MAKGTEIIVSADTKGTFLEGIVSGTPVPGTVMEIKNVAPVQGRHTWQPWSKASGAIGLIAVLLADTEQGQLSTTAYVDGKRCFLYCPIGGEELNMSLNDVAGTADDVAIGALFGVEQTTGQMIANSSYAYPCFTAMEAITDPVADQPLWMTYNG